MTAINLSVPPKHNMSSFELIEPEVKLTVFEHLPCREVKLVKYFDCCSLFQLRLASSELFHSWVSAGCMANSNSSVSEKPHSYSTPESPIIIQFDIGMGAVCEGCFGSDE